MKSKAEHDSWFERFVEHFQLRCRQTGMTAPTFERLAVNAMRVTMPNGKSATVHLRDGKPVWEGTLSFK